MFGCTKIGNLPYVRSFGEARDLFAKAPRPNAKHLRGDWSDNERPLVKEYDQPFRFHHYRLEHGHGEGGVEFYDVCLYATAMARYYKPQGDKRVVLYSGHSSQASNAFKWNVLKVCEWEDYVTTDGRTVRVPQAKGSDGIYDEGGGRHGARSFACRLTFDGERLVVDESDHARIVKFRASAWAREKRKAIKEVIGNPVMLAVMRLPQYRDESDADYSTAKPYKGYETNFSQNRALEKVCIDPSQLGVDEWEWFFSFGQKVYDFMLSKRLRNNDAAFITEHEFMRVLTNAVILKGGGHFPRDEVAIPKFSPAEDIPMTNIRIK